MTTEPGWPAYVDNQLALKRCPYTGDRLKRFEAVWGDGYYCELCDCFGFDRRDPRIPE